MPGFKLRQMSRQPCLQLRETALLPGLRHQVRWPIASLAHSSNPATSYPTTPIQPYAAIQTPDDFTRLNLGRQLLPGSIYAFEITAVDAKRRVSPTARSQEFQLR